MLTTRPLTPETWDDFATLVAAHNGVFGGCWCLGFHDEGAPGGLSVAARQAAKRERVMRGQAHAALVYEGAACVGWCQYGSPSELPRIKNRKAYEAGQGPTPAWRITCFFVDRHHRRQGVARAALEGALADIVRAGGGRVEAYPEDVHGQKVSPTFLHAGTVSLFAAAGFMRERPIGKNKWVMATTL